MKELFIEYAEAGLSVIPVRCDGSKAPALATFEEFKSRRRPTAEDIERWFAGKPEDHKVGIAIICGSISGGLVVLDFETKLVFAEWQSTVDADGGTIDDLPIVETPRGFHVYCRLPEAQGGRKIACVYEDYEDKDGERRTRHKTLIEVRGQGQYVVGPGSPRECHPSHSRGWDLRWGPDVTETPEISIRRWESLLRCAESFNEVVDARRRVDGVSTISADDQRPGTDYCRRSGIADFTPILERAGWTLAQDRGGRQLWRRPGKDVGCSATLGVVKTDLGDALYVFSTSAHPFEAGASYSLFAVRALLDYAGDYSRCAAECRAEGYGEPAPEEIRQQVSDAIAYWGDPVRTTELETIAEGCCASSVAFRRTWDRKRDAELGDDAHRYCRAILYFAARSLGTPERSGLSVGVGLVGAWRRRYFLEPRLAEDVTYMARQATDVLSVIDASEGELHTTTEARESGVDRAAKLKWLSGRFGFGVDGWVQVRSNAEEATFWLVAGGHRVKIGDIKSWESCAAFERALRGWSSPSGEGVPGFAGKLPDKLRAKVAWSSVMVVLYEVREIDGGDDTTTEALVDWIAEFAERSGVFETGEKSGTWDDAALSGAPFLRDGKFYLNSDSFHRWVNIRKNESFSRRGLVDELRAAGLEKCRMAPTDRAGIRRTRKLWAIDADRVRDRCVGGEMDDAMLGCGPECPPIGKK